MGIDAVSYNTKGGYMEGVDFGYIIGILGTVVAMYFALRTDARDSKQETNSLVEKESEHASESAVIAVELKYIRENLDEIKENQKTADKRYIGTINELSEIKGHLQCLDTRVVALERGVVDESQLR